MHARAGVYSFEGSMQMKLLAQSEEAQDSRTKKERSFL
jgi:hypothetical protein